MTTPRWRAISSVIARTIKALADLSAAASWLVSHPDKPAVGARALVADARAVLAGVVRDLDDVLDEWPGEE